MANTLQRYQQAKYAIKMKLWRANISMQAGYVDCHHEDSAPELVR